MTTPEAHRPEHPALVLHQYAGQAALTSAQRVVVEGQAAELTRVWPVLRDTRAINSALEDAGRPRLAITHHARMEPIKRIDTFLDYAPPSTEENYQDYSHPNKVRSPDFKADDAESFPQKWQLEPVADWPDAIRLTMRVARGAYVQPGRFGGMLVADDDFNGRPVAWAERAAVVAPRQFTDAVVVANNPKLAQEAGLDRRATLFAAYAVCKQLVSTDDPVKLGPDGKPDPRAVIL